MEIVVVVGGAAAHRIALLRLRLFGLDCFLTELSLP